MPNSITRLIPVRDRQALILGEDHMVSFADLATGRIFWNRRLDELLGSNLNAAREWAACDAEADAAWFCAGNRAACVSLTDGKPHRQLIIGDVADQSVTRGLFAEGGDAWVWRREEQKGMAALLRISGADGSIATAASWQETAGTAAEARACVVNGIFFAAVEQIGMQQTELHAIAPDRGEMWNTTVPDACWTCSRWMG